MLQVAVSCATRLSLMVKGLLVWLQSHPSSFPHRPNDSHVHLAYWLDEFTLQLLSLLVALLSDV